MVKITHGWKSRNIAEILTALSSDSEKGLDKYTVIANRRKWGKNDLWYTGSPFMFFGTESGFSTLGFVIMAIAAFSAAAFGKCNDYIFVGIALLCGIVISALLYLLCGFVCMNHCIKWIPGCTVVREGKAVRIKADMLVLGDVVLLGKGDRVYADVKLISSDGVTVREPAFTKRKGALQKAAAGSYLAAEGQSLPEDFIYAGSEILSGSARAVVCTVGDGTSQGKIGKIKLTQNRDTMKLASLRKKGVSAGALAMIFSFAATAAGVFIPLAATDFIGVFIIFLAFAVSAGGEMVPALCCLAYYLSIKKSENASFFIRDTAGVDYLCECDGICAEDSSLMKSEKTELKAVWTSGSSTERGDSSADELFSLMLAGTNYGYGKYGGEVQLAVNEHMAGKGDAAKFISSVMNTKPVIEHKAVGTTHYSLFISGGEQYFAVTGSIEDVISKCTRLRINGNDRPIGRDDISNILSSASAALRSASSIIAVAVRVSPYNSIKRLSVLTSDLSFVGFIAMETPPHPTLPSGLAQIREEGVRFMLFTDGGGEDVNFARKLGIIKGREDLVSGISPDDATMEIMSENSHGGAVYIPSEDYVSDLLNSIKKSGKRLVFVGSEKYAVTAGFAAVPSVPAPCSGGYLTCKKGGEVASVIDSYIASRNIFRRLNKAYIYLSVSALIRAVYCMTVVFGMPYVYPSLVLGWGLLLDAIVAGTVMLFDKKA